DHQITRLPDRADVPTRVYLLSLKPVGTATSPADTSVAILSTSCDVVRNVARGLPASSFPLGVIFFDRPPSRPPSPEGFASPSSDFAPDDDRPFDSCATCSADLTVSTVVVV